MKNDDPRLADRPSDFEGRDTRLDPADVQSPPDKTEPGMALSELEAGHILSSNSPQASPFPPRIAPPPFSTGLVVASSSSSSIDPVVHEVLYEGADSTAPPPRTSEHTEALRARAPRRRTGWPFLPLAPLLVVVVGVAVALGIGLVGLD